jgi:CheY-like chemotaxis protein
MDDTVKEVEILLVEDNPTDAKLCIRALKKSNLANKLVWVKDGAEALDFLFATGAYSGRQAANGPNPKVILLDLRLPKVDGMEVLRRVKNDERTRTIPVVVLTSSREDRDIVESYQLGVNSYISKPVGFDEFVRTVSELGFYWLLVNQPPVTK